MYRFHADSLSPVGYRTVPGGFVPDIAEQTQSYMMRTVIPKDRTELNSFLGMARFYKDVIPDFNIPTKKLEGIGKNKPIHQHRNAEMARTFIMLKYRILNSPRRVMLTTRVRTLMYIGFRFYYL